MAYLTNIEARVSGVWVDALAAPGRWSCVMDDGSRIYAVSISSASGADAVRVNGGAALTLPGGFASPGQTVLVKVDATGAGVWVSGVFQSTSNIGGFVSDGTHVYAAVGFPFTTVTLYDSDGISRLTASNGDVIKMDTDGFWVAKSTAAFHNSSTSNVHSIDIGGGRLVVGTQGAGITAYTADTLAQEWLIVDPGRPGRVIVSVSESGEVACINGGTTSSSSRIRFDFRDGATGAIVSSEALTSSSRPNLVTGGATLAFNGTTVAFVGGLRASTVSGTITFGADSYTYTPPTSEYGLIVAVYDTSTSSWLWSDELAVGDSASAGDVAGAAGSIVGDKIRGMWQKNIGTPIFFQQWDRNTGTLEWTASADTAGALFVNGSNNFSHSFDVDASGSGWFAIPAVTTYTSSDAGSQAGFSSVNLGNINNAGLFGVTSLGLPEVVTDPPSFITISTADLNGTLVSDGGDPPVTGGFEVATSPDPLDIVQTVDAGTIVVGSFTETATGLTPGTTYYVRAYATNTFGTAYGAWVEFTMLGAIPPLVTTGTATDIDFFDATLSGSLIDPGDGTIDIVGFVLGLATDPELGDPGTIDVIGTLDEADDFFGEATGLQPGTTYYWRAYGINSFGAIGYGDSKDFDTDDPRPPSFVRITMPDADEENASVGTADFETDPMEVGTYVWEVSAQVAEPYTGGTSAILVDTNGLTAGTVAITGQDDTAQTAEVTFTPEPHWFGTVQFSIRVGNTYAFSNWRTTNVTILPIPDAPSVPSGALPTLDEDTTATFDLTWTDPDDLPPGTLSAQDGYSVDIRPVSGGEWRTLTPDSPAVSLPGVTFRVITYSDTELRATLRVEPDSNYNGPYSASFRIRDDVEEVPIFGPSVDLFGTVTSVPDAPSRPQPARMTTAKVGQDVATIFRTFDPDLEDTSWTFEISAVGANTWGSSLVIPNVGTLTVVDADTSDQQAQVKLTQQAGGATELRYEFDLRVVDSSTLASPVQKVSGFITPPGASVFLQKLTRDGGATITPLTPLREVVELNVVDSIEGQGAADVLVSTDELRRRAVQLGIDLVDLLDPGTVELVVAIGGERIFVGPIGDIEWSATDDTTSISARGLLAYLDDRRIGTSTASFVNTDIAAIMWTLIDDTQTLSYGDLGFTDSTITAGTNLTVDFKEDTRIADALRTLSQTEGGPEVWITPERQVTTGQARGSDKRASIRITAGMMDVARWISRDEQLATVVTVIGGEDLLGGFYQATVVTSDTTALDKYGRRERFINRPELTSNLSCEEYAQRILDGQARRLETITLETVVTPERPFSIRDLEVGDIITVDLRAPDLGQVIGAYRIVNRRLDLVSETADSYRVRLDLVPAPIVSSLLVQVKARHNASVFERLAQMDSQQRLV